MHIYSCYISNSGFSPLGAIKLITVLNLSVGTAARLFTKKEAVIIIHRL